VYPNPTKGILFLKVENSSTTIQIEIYSLSGSMIYKSSVIGNSVIDFGRLNIGSGIYLVKTKCNEQNSIRKVIYQP
jgi:Secretion system C-terminal sorting domain